MVNIAQTDVATSVRIDLRWDCTLIVEMRCSREKFRPQPVWDFEIGETAGPNRQAGGLRAPGPDCRDDPMIADRPLAIAAIARVAQQQESNCREGTPSRLFAGFRELLLQARA